LILVLTAAHSFTMRLRHLCSSYSALLLYSNKIILEYNLNEVSI